MRLWHYKLVHYLPDSQLKAQWRELNLIFKSNGEVNHILINYIKEYPKKNLLRYTCLVLHEMGHRGYVSNWNAMDKYFSGVTPDISLIQIDKQLGVIDNPFPAHHDARYLKQCFYNLQEKYDRGQKDFSEEIYARLYSFVNDEFYGVGV